MKRNKGSKTVISTVLLLSVLFVLGCNKKQEVEVVEPEPELVAEVVQDTPIAIQPRIVIPGISALAFSGDGKYFLAGTSEGYLHIWETLTGKRLWVLELGQPVQSAAIDPAGRSVAAGTADGEIRIWNLAGGKQVGGFNTAGPLVSLDFDTAGAAIVSLSPNGGIARWDSRTGKPLPGSPESALSFSQAVLGFHAERILLASQDGLRLLPSGGGDPIGNFPAPSGAASLAQSLEGNSIAASGGETITLWNLPAGESSGAITSSGGISALALNGSGNRLLSGHQDGMVRLWDTVTGAELVTYLATGGADGDWISMVSEGFYNASAHGAALISIQDGEENYALSQLAEALYRPDVFYHITSGEGEVPKENLKTLLRDNNFQPPVVIFLSPPDMSVPGGTVELSARITVRGGGLGPVTVYNADIPEDIYTIDEIKTSEGDEAEGHYYEVTVSVPVEPGTNHIGLGAFNRSGIMESEVPQREVASSASPAGSSKPALHVLLAGIGDYRNSEVPDLGYTIADAEALKELFLQQKDRSLFSKVTVSTLYNEEVTKEGFARSFENLKVQVRKDDTFVFFFSGHGGVDRGGDFYFYPYDSIGDDNPAENNIAKTDIVKNILRIKARDTLIMLDTCQSGAILNMDTAFGRLWQKLERKAVLAAAAGNQYAIESPKFGHGLFTWSILGSLEGKAVPAGERYIGVTEMINQVRTDVPEIADAVVAEAVSMALVTKEEAEAYAKKGGSFDDAVIRQEPLAKLPASNFQIIDLGEFWESLPVKSGSFSMGSPTGEAERKGEETPHQIRVGDFLIGKYEVTQEEYSSLMGANPSRFRNPKRPVEQVSWFDAVEYCNRRSAREGLQPAYSINGREVRWNRNADGYRLPTEAEWEYACRAGTTGPFSTGANITTDQANYNGNFSYNGARRGRDRTETTQTGSFAPNPWGIYDMHGNVWEWCWDWKAAYPAENAANPAGPASGSYKTARGGSWRVGAQSLRSALRGSNPPEDRGDGLGFRLVRSVAR